MGDGSRQPKVVCMGAVGLFASGKEPGFIAFVSCPLFLLFVLLVLARFVLLFHLFCFFQFLDSDLDFEVACSDRHGDVPKPGVRQRIRVRPVT